MINRLNQLKGETVQMNDSMDQFMEINQRVQIRFEQITNSLQKLKPYVQQVDQAISEKEENQITKIFEEQYEKLKSNFKTVNEDLKKMEDMAHSSDFEQFEQNNIQINVKGQYKQLEQKLKETQKVFVDFNSIKKKKRMRFIGLTDEYQNCSEEQIEQIAEDPDQVKQIMMKELNLKPSNRLKYQAEDIIEKCQGIKNLQRNIRELLDMIKDISVIVKAQGEKVETIADHVKGAKDAMVRVKKNLDTAKKHHQDARTRMCLIIVLSVIILVIILSVVFTQINQLYRLSVFICSIYAIYNLSSFSNNFCAYLRFFTSKIYVSIIYLNSSPGLLYVKLFQLSVLRSQKLSYSSYNSFSLFYFLSSLNPKISYYICSSFSKKSLEKYYFKSILL